jgi:ABC-type glycerol-3-phosphate transport system permease component
MNDKHRFGRIALLALAALLVAVPLYIALVAASHSARDLLGQFPLLPGSQLIHNLASVLFQGLPGAPPVWLRASPSASWSSPFSRPTRWSISAFRCA